MSIALVVQGLYFTLSGLWPVIHMPSFLLVTGPKADQWLVRCVGLLIAVIGITLLMLGLESPTSNAACFLGVASAASLAGVDLIYVSNRTIPRIYLLDAAAELFFIAWLLLECL